MSEKLTISCGMPDNYGREWVVATCGHLEYRDQIHAMDEECCAEFAEAALEEFGRPVTAETVAQIKALVLREAEAVDDVIGEPGGLPPRVTSISKVAPRDVEWLWPGRIPLGAITVLAGNPGLGKSFVTLDMAARVSRGGAWPDENRQGDKEWGRQGDVPLTDTVKYDVGTAGSKPASVVLFSAEDDLATTIRPRLEALGADCARIVTVEALDNRDGVARGFELGCDLDKLTTAVGNLGDCRLVIIDPVSAYLGRTGESTNARVRALLTPLAAMASRHRLAVVLVSHLRKKEGIAMYRTLGSMAFVAAARAAWMVVGDRQCSSRRLFIPLKNNLAPDLGGLAYTIEPLGPANAPVVCWAAGGAELSIDFALKQATAPAHRPDTERQLVMEWLRGFLAGGPQLTRVVREASEAHGFTYGTLRRAFREVGCQATKSGGTGRGAWQWGLPGAPAGENAVEDPAFAPVVLRGFGPHDVPMYGVGDVSALSTLGK